MKATYNLVADRKLLCLFFFYKKKTLMSYLSDCVTRRFLHSSGNPFYSGCMEPSVNEGHCTFNHNTRKQLGAYLNFATRCMVVLFVFHIYIYIYF